MVRRILKKNKLRPHKNRYWCVLPSDPVKRKAFVAAMEDVLEVYARPYGAKHPVVCMSEKPCVLHGDTRETMEAIPGIDRWQNHEYKPRGTCSAFMFLEPLAGEKYVSVRKHRKAVNFAYELLASQRDIQTPRRSFWSSTISTPIRLALYKPFPKDMADALAKRFEFHRTPVHASSLNIAEIGLSVLSREAMGHLRFPTIKKLRNQLKTWRKARGPIKVNWQFAAKEAKTKLRSLYPSERLANQQFVGGLVLVHRTRLTTSRSPIQAALDTVSIPHKLHRIARMHFEQRRTSLKETNSIKVCNTILSEADIRSY